MKVYRLDARIHPEFVRSLPNPMYDSVTPSISINASIKFICHFKVALQPFRGNVAYGSLSLDVNRHL